VTEEVHARSLDNSLPVGIMSLASRQWFACPFHIYEYWYHNLETNPVYLVSTSSFARLRRQWQPGAKSPVTPARRLCFRWD